MVCVGVLVLHWLVWVISVRVWDVKSIREQRRYEGGVACSVCVGGECAGVVSTPSTYGPPVPFRLRGHKGPITACKLMKRYNILISR